MVSRMLLIPNVGTDERGNPLRSFADDMKEKVSQAWTIRRSLFDEVVVEFETTHGAARDSLELSELRTPITSKINLVRL